MTVQTDENQALNILRLKLGSRPSAFHIDEECLKFGSRPSVLSYR